MRPPVCDTCKIILTKGLRIDKMWLYDRGDNQYKESGYLFDLDFCSFSCLSIFMEEHYRELKG